MTMAMTPTEIMNNGTNKKMETEYSTSIIKITNKKSITEAGATKTLFLPATSVKNVQPAGKPISINLSDRSKLRSSHTCNLDIEGITEKENLAHIVPGLSHASLISISFLCNAGCKGRYDEKICSVYYNSKLVWIGGRESQTIFWIFPLQECNTS